MNCTLGDVQANICMPPGMFCKRINYQMLEQLLRGKIEVDPVCDVRNVRGVI